jgi:ferredoxin
VSTQLQRTEIAFGVRLPDGRELAMTAPVGARLMPVLRDAQLPIAAICGGELSCGTCHVLLSESDYDRLPPPREDEAEMLDVLPETIAGRSRLSCQIVVDESLDGLSIEIPDD